MAIRAIFCATSDLAAMGAIPYCMFLSLTIPKNKGSSFFKSIANGIEESIDRVGISLAGGDLTSYSGPLAISVTVVGRKKCIEKALLRRGSKVGDYIGVTGFIGDAYLGLKILEKKYIFLIENIKKLQLTLFYFHHNFINLLPTYQSMQKLVLIFPMV